MTRPPESSLHGRQRPRAFVEGLEERVLLSRAIGIDVSNYQPSVNWTNVKAAGYTFAWTKATEGYTYDDPSFTSARMNAAKNAGVLIGAYHYARYDNNPAANEVSHFLSVAGNYVKAGWLIPMLDVEAPVTSTDLNHTRAQISAWVNAWCQGVLNATGVRPIVYTYISYASTYLDSSVTQWPLNMANYNGQNPQTGGPNATSPWSTWNFWQNNDTSGNANVPGDVDVFNGTVAQLQNWVIMSAPTTPSPASGATTTGSPSVLNWADVQYAASYDVYIDGTFRANVTSSQYTVNPAMSVGNHTWQVKAKNNTGTVASPVWNLTVNSAVSLNAPGNAAVTGTTANSVSLSWTDTSTGEAQYVIERKTGANGTYQSIGTAPANATSFTDSSATDLTDPPQPGTVYYYRVHAQDGGIGFGPYSAEVSGMTYAATPIGVTASNGTFADGVHLSWLPAAGAVSYQLYRSSSSDSATAALLAPSTQSTYTDGTADPGATYYYWVASRDTAGRLSPLSASASGSRAVDAIAPTCDGESADAQQAGHPVSFTFSEDVHASLSVEDLTVTNLTSGEAVAPIGVSYDGDTNTATFTLPTALADGNYTAVLNHAGVTDLAGNPLAADVTVAFFLLAGDANHDRAVDTLDFNALAANFGGVNKTYAQADFNYDGTVDTLDFNTLAAQFGTSLAAPASSRGALSAVASGGTISPFSQVAVTGTTEQNLAGDILGDGEPGAGVI